MPTSCRSSASAPELARELKVPVTRVTEILRGRRGISGDTALRLGRYFQVSPDFWMNLQKLYEIDLARRQIGEDLASIMPRACGRGGEGMRTLG